MDEQKSGSDVREALSAFQQYLSDSLAPLVAADSVVVLLNQPPQLLAAEIQAWITTQYRGKGASVPVSDYLFHAMKKLHDMGQLKLIPEGPLAKHLDDLAQIILEYCPEEDREMLRENLNLLGEAETTLTSPTAFVHRQKGTRRPLASQGRAIDATVPDEVYSDETTRGGRRFALLLRRLERELKAAEGLGSELPENRTELLSQAIAAAAGDSQTSTDFRQYQELLQNLGMEARTDQVFRALGRSLPGWVAPAPPEPSATEVPLYQSPAVEAMRQIIKLSDDKREGGKRFEEMVQAAIEQFNEGSLARAVTMLDLAESIISENKVEGDVVGQVRTTAHELLDSNRLRALAENPDKHHLLRKVLNFFDELTPQGLLDNLKVAPKRDRRRLLLGLLEVHGNATRTVVLERLESLGSSISEWYLPRNLLYLLYRIPRPADAPLEKEIDLMDRLLKPENPAPLVREVIANLRMMKHERAERALITGLKEFEEKLLRPGPSSFDTRRLRHLLDRIVSALAWCGTPSAFRVVVDHGLKRQPELGDTIARLINLAGHDLSGDNEVVERLVKALKAEIPFKLLGFIIQKSTKNLLHLIEALSTTPAPSVRRTFEEIVERYPQQEFARVAWKALDAMDTAGRATRTRFASLSGDLEIFGLPDLLQKLADSRVTGMLTLKDQKGETFGSLSLQEGKIQSCHAGRLRDDNGLYQLFERPVPGIFEFVSQRNEGSEPDLDTPPAREVIPIILEGMRRYDEFQRACAIVPDRGSCKPTGIEPPPHPDEEDPALFKAVWEKAIAGTSPNECEAHILTDPYRIRRLFAHWVEQGALELN